VPSLFYIRLIGFTAGTLVYLFLLALILGHRKPRLFERLLFFVCLSLFLIYAGGLLEINSIIQYTSPPEATRVFYQALIALGMFLLLPLVWHIHFAYGRQVRKSPPGVWGRPLVFVLYLVALIELGLGFWFLGGGLRQIPVALSHFLVPGWAALPAIALGDAVFELRDWRASIGPVERRFFRSLLVASSLLGVLLALYRWFPAIVQNQTYAILTAAILAGIMPGTVIIYFFLRHNFLEYGAQRNLMYALPVTFLALLYLALVRRVGGWLEPVVPPEATAAVLLFSLIFLFEPLERVIGPALHRRFQEGLGGVQQLSVGLQQEARQGNVAHLVTEAERRVREEYGLAVVRISVPRDATAGTLSAPGGLGHAVTLPLIKDGQEIGVLEAASSGSYLTGETTAALEFLGKQLSGMIDLARLIEDKLRLERQLAERERMASLGQMAATVSHNLRNPLSSMKTVLQVQLENPELPVDVRRDCTLVVNEIDRMSAKLSQLLRYAKPSVGGQRVAAVALANQTAVLFRHDAERRNVRIEFERPTEEIFALGSEEALSEILSNLIVNAIEAQTGGGRVKVGLARYDGRLEIMVEDGGPGISQELRAKIFQPYFTTKPTGTGLGLSIVARRVEEIGGTISCESPVRNGKGTRFRLMLPVAVGDGEGTAV
jgi:signal transduction histidine kinase